jgi:hypothetical protein
MGRDQLAMIYGHRDWKEWKDEKTTSTPADDHTIQTVMMTEAEVILQNSTDVSEFNIGKLLGRIVQLFGFSFIEAILGLTETLYRTLQQS